MTATGAEITGRTGVYVHLSHPSTHVRTPQTFNRAFAERGIDVVAVSADVAPADLAATVDGLRGWRNLAGIGVTMPHKAAIAALCDELTPAAAAIGSANAIKRTEDGRLIGENTDGSGFVRGLTDHAIPVAGAHALVVGVGGAGRAVAWALAEAGVATLTLANRTAAKAEDLAAQLGAAHPGVAVAAGPPDPSGHTLVVNATSLGMRESDPLPVDPDRLAPRTVVAEIIMEPRETPLMRAAAGRGCVVQEGLPMLTSQIDLVVEYLGLGKGESRA
ncbi:shikimate dehydrogenase family protein [Jiangella alba]|uniref:shikimate dehydrogenase (NADP(+)) n=1 Tax=Jiangella alba TaxID=561176 RepID=A0A1H5MMI4_9ACTN|nr:shikimate dehydrogenase [Jiangella alba]SEE90605.1 shikimate dehydrogenase [Jiangella alba]